MKKLIEKDKKIRFNIKSIEKKHFILKFIFNNFNFFILIRWFALLKLKLLAKNISKTSIVNRCLLSVNKKRFSKLTVFSRHIFIKLIKTASITGMRKSSW